MQPVYTYSRVTYKFTNFGLAFLGPVSFFLPPPPKNENKSSSPPPIPPGGPPA